MSDPAPGNRFLTTTQAAAYLRDKWGADVPDWTLRRLAKDGAIRAYRPRGWYKFSRRALDEWARKQGFTPTA